MLNLSKLIIQDIDEARIFYASFFVNKVRYSVLTYLPKTNDNNTAIYLQFDVMLWKINLPFLFFVKLQSSRYDVKGDQEVLCCIHDHVDSSSGYIIWI